MKNAEVRQVREALVKKKVAFYGIFPKWPDAPPTFGTFDSPFGTFESLFPKIFNKKFQK